MLVVCLGAGAVLAIISGVWLLVLAPLLLVAQIWANSTIHSRFRPNHPTFLGVGELFARKKTLSIRYPTLLAFVVLASAAVCAAIRIMEAYPKQKFKFVVFLFFAVPVILYLLLVIEVLQLPKADGNGEMPGGGKPDA